MLQTPIVRTVLNVCSLMLLVFFYAFEQLAISNCGLQLYKLLQSAYLLVLHDITLLLLHLKHLQMACSQHLIDLLQNCLRLLLLVVTSYALDVLRALQVTTGREVR